MTPRAGIILLSLVACNAYLNYTYVHMRMYGCVVLASGIVMWLYLRVTLNHQGTTARRWLALFAAILSLLMFHVLSTLFLLSMLFSYHALFVAKSRRWFAFPLAVACALLLASPYLAKMFAIGLAGSHIDRLAENTLSMTVILPIEFIRAGMSVLLNSSFGLGQLALLMLPLAGIVLSLADSRTVTNLRILLLWMLGFVLFFQRNLGHR